MRLLDDPSLYKTLSEDGNPRLETIVAILRELGFRFAVMPQQPGIGPR